MTTIIATIVITDITIIMKIPITVPTSTTTGREFVKWAPVTGPRKVWEPRQDITRVKGSNQLKFEIEAIFLRSQVLQDDVDKFIEKNLKSCDIESIANLVYMSVKASKSQDKCLLKKHLPSIVKKLKMIPSLNWNIKQITFIFYGLQCFDEDDEGIYISIYI